MMGIEKARLDGGESRDVACWRLGGSAWPWVFAIIAAAGAVGVTLAVNGRLGYLHFPCVLVASTGFVLVAIAGGALGSGYGRFILVGLMAFWCGDVLGGEYFLSGLVAFCLGHIAYICAFVTKGIAWKRLVAALFPVAAATVTVLGWLLPHVERPVDVVAVCAYCTIISLMVLTAFGASEGPVGRMIVAAAVIVYVSDIFVARWRFVHPEAINGYFCYPLYYLACLILGMSVSVRKCGLARCVERE